MHTCRFRLVSLVVAALGTAVPFAHAGDVNIGVSITGEIVPGVYGRVDLTNRPAPPPVVYAQPVIVEQVPGVERAAPIYLHVPPGHAKNWRKYCHQYHACNQRVFFVKSAEYEPGYRPDRDHGHHGHDDHYDRHDDRDHRDDYDHHDDHDHRDHGDHDHHDHDHHDHDHHDHDHHDHDHHDHGDHDHHDHDD
jgi:hypothetical protein